MIKISIATTLAQIGCSDRITATTPPTKRNGAKKDPKIGNIKGVITATNMANIPTLKLV